MFETSSCPNKFLIDSWSNTDSTFIGGIVTGQMTIAPRISEDRSLKIAPVIFDCSNLAQNKNCATQANFIGGMNERTWGAGQ